MKTYDVALSFAGEDRRYVEEVASSLKAMGIRVFYDAYDQAGLWGKNLYTHLSRIYKDESQYVVIFISKSYSEKVWTNHERESAQARAFEENTEYILPARFDDTDVPGILKTTSYINLSSHTPSAFALLIAQKIRDGDYWQRELAEAAQICSRAFMEAHRGAILWRKDVVAIFDNRVEDDRDPYILAVHGELTHLPLLARSRPGAHPILSLFETTESILATEIHKLVWRKFSDRIQGEKNSHVYLEAQQEIADRVTGSAQYIPLKGDKR